VFHLIDREEGTNVKVEGSYTFEAPREMTYDMLQDPEVLTKIIPGCEQLNKVGENEYEAALEISVGPIKGKFKGKVLLSDLNRPESYKMEVNGTGQAGFVKGTGLVKLEDQGASTLMNYEGDAQVGGRIASVGQRFVESAAKALIKQSLENVNQHVQAHQQAKVADAPAPEIKAPTQVEFATGVAKEVAKDLVPPSRRPLVIGAGVGLAVLAFILLRPRRKKEK
jgi:carbon monoxide dehydrogenase subunit G